MLAFSIEARDPTNGGDGQIAYPQVRGVQYAEIYVRWLGGNDASGVGLDVVASGQEGAPCGVNGIEQIHTVAVSVVRLEEDGIEIEEDGIEIEEDGIELACVVSSALPPAAGRACWINAAVFS